MKTFLVVFAAIGLTASDKLDRTYLPPPGSKFSGGSPGAIQTPLEFPKETYTTSLRPQGFVNGVATEDIHPTVGINRRLGTPNIPEGSQDFIPGTSDPNAPHTDFQSNFPTDRLKFPATTTSYAFSQTTTFPTPIDGYETSISPFSQIHSGFQTNIPTNLLQVANYPQQTFFEQPQQVVGQRRPGTVQSGDTNQYPQLGEQSMISVQIPGTDLQGQKQIVSESPQTTSLGSKAQRPGFDSQSLIMNDRSVLKNIPTYFTPGIQTQGVNQYQSGRPTSAKVQSTNFTSRLPIHQNQGLEYTGAQYPTLSNIQQSTYPSTILPQNFSFGTSQQYNGETVPGIISQGSNIQIPTLPGQKIAPEQLLTQPGISQRYPISSTSTPTTSSVLSGESGFFSTTPGTISSYDTSSPFPEGNLSSPTQTYAGIPSSSIYPIIPNQVLYTHPERPQAESDRNAVIVNYENVLTPEGFAYSFDTSNGIHADESGTAIDGVKAQGSYSYIGDDGKLYEVIYTADENGFQPRGDHLPTAPPIPEAIQKVIEQNARDEEDGIYDDGSYDDTKYGHKKYQIGANRYQSRTKDIDYDKNIPEDYESQLNEKKKKKRPESRTGNRRPVFVTKDEISDLHGDDGDLVNGDISTRVENRIPTAHPGSNKNEQNGVNIISTDDRKLIIKPNDHVFVDKNTAIRRPVTGKPKEGLLISPKDKYADSLDKEYTETFENEDDFVKVPDQDVLRGRPLKQDKISSNGYNEDLSDSLHGRQDYSAERNIKNQESTMRPNFSTTMYKDSKSKPQAAAEIDRRNDRRKFNNARPKGSSIERYGEISSDFSKPAGTAEDESTYDQKEIPSKIGYGQKIVNQPREQIPFGRENNYLSQKTTNKKSGYQYIPPQNKFRQGDRLLTRFYSRDELGSTKRPGEGYEDKTLQPFMTSNVGRDDESSDKHLYSPTTDKSTRFDEADIKEGNGSDYYEEKQHSKSVYDEGVTKGKTQLRKDFTRISSTRRPFYGQTQSTGTSLHETDQRLTQKGSSKPTQRVEGIYSDDKDGPKVTSFSDVSSTTPMPSESTRFGSTQSSKDGFSEQSTVKYQYSTRRPFNAYTDRTIQSTIPGTSFSTPIRQGIKEPHITPPESLKSTSDFSDEGITDSAKRIGFELTKPQTSVRPSSPLVTGTLRSNLTPEVTSTVTEFSRSRLPSSTYQPQIDNTNIPDKTVPSQYGIPSKKSSDAIGDDKTPSTTYRPNYTIQSKESIEPNVIVDAYGRVIPNREQIQGFPGTTAQPGAPRDQTLRSQNANQGRKSEYLRPTSEFRPVPDFTQETTSYPEYFSTPKVFGEDFSGPKQPQKYDPETGYHYK